MGRPRCIRRTGASRASSAGGCRWQPFSRRASTSRGEAGGALAEAAAGHGASDVGEEAVAFKPVRWQEDDPDEWLHAWLEDGVLNVACGPRSLRRAVDFIREAITWRTGRI